MNADITIFHWPNVETITTTDMVVGGVGSVLAIVILSGFIALLRK